LVSEEDADNVGRKADKHRNTARSFIIDVVVVVLVVVEFCVVRLLETRDQIKSKQNADLETELPIAVTQREPAYFYLD
jgi:hypothetical protein